MAFYVPDIALPHHPALPVVPITSLASPAVLPPQYVSYTNDPARAVIQTPTPSAIASGYYPPGLGGLPVGSSDCSDAHFTAANRLYLPVDVHRNVSRQDTAVNAAHRGPVRNRAGIPY